jgi:hypothetical protein
MTLRRPCTELAEAASRAPGRALLASTRGALPEHAAAGVAIIRAREPHGSYLATPVGARGRYRPLSDGLDRNGATSRERAGELAA